MISILTGDARFAIEREIAAYKAEINSTWQHFNYHRFGSNELETAISLSRTAPFGSGKKVVVIENCNFKQFGEEGYKLLQCLPHLPETTHLIFVASAIDKRLKISQLLLKHGKLMEFPLFPPWRTDLIASSIANQAKDLNLRLSRDVVSYLAQAIGNDTTKAATELNKLAVFAQGNCPTKEQVRDLVPATSQTSLQLAEAVRLGKVTQTTTLLNELLARGEHPQAIVSTLITQFRTWLWVKSAIEGGMKKDMDIAQFCGVGNPKRMYFLRQEVRSLSLISLSQVLTKLLDLEIDLKGGADCHILLPTFLQVVHLFRVNLKIS
ncbi:MAG: DNA polymerase III subunit delta [Hydrococcus sp. Prado102]|jgi:DNA polymerase-3 subunit delta|nr:DNA polymerase III subunit delta [Hydrococcus sp. Prado102]